MVDDLKSKTLIENPGDKGGLNDRVRVSEGPKVLVGESNSGTVISGTQLNSVESGNLGADRKNKSIRQNVSRNNNRWESWGVMNMVGRVLDGKLYMDDDVEDVDTCQDVIGEPKIGANDKNPGDEGVLNDGVRVLTLNAENRGEVDLTASTGTWQDVIGESKSENKIDIKSPDTDNDSVKLDLSCPAEGSGLNGNCDLISQETVPNGPMETGEDFNVEDEEELNDQRDLFIPKTRGENDVTEKEGEYYVSDLVWGKVKCHPWWPGQIFSPLSASDKAAIHLKADSYLIAYFGDQTFAWNEGSKIKPFRMYFSEMEKQSSSDRFSHAVQCALDEAARRVEFGLSCPCLPLEVHDKIKFQIVENAGVMGGLKRTGGDNLSSASTFLPGDVLQFLESLAVRPQAKPDRLQFATAKAQIMAYNRWKGHYQFPGFEECSGLLEDDAVLNLAMATAGVLPGPVSDAVSSKKRKSTARDGSSSKPKRLSGDAEGPKIKEKSLSDLMFSGENLEMVNSLTSTSKGKRGRKKKSMLATSPHGESLKAKAIPAEILTPDIVLSNLIVAAKEPMKAHDALIPVLCVLRDLRNSVCLEKSGAVNVQEDSGKRKREWQSDLQTADAFGLEGIKDSYWTDRIIQSYSQDQELYGSQKPKESVPQAQAQAQAQAEADVAIVPNVDDNKEGNNVVDLDAEGPSVVVNEESDDYCPTALILNFSDLEAIPPVMNLNQIFSRYGPLVDSETKILTKGKRAKVIFKRRADAETAFSSTGKYSIFGPSLVSYRLQYALKLKKTRATLKWNKKDKPLKDEAV